MKLSSLSRIAKRTSGQRHGPVTRLMSPSDFGLEELPSEGLVGGDAAGNAARARTLLAGEQGAARSSVVMSAAAALYVAGMAGFEEGARRAERAIDEGAATALLERLVVTSRAR